MPPAELYARRFGNRSVGWLLFVFFTVYTLPYMVTAVVGVGGSNVTNDIAIGLRTPLAAAAVRHPPVSRRPRPGYFLSVTQ